MMKRHNLLTTLVPVLVVLAMLAVSVTACAPATPAPTSAPAEEPVVAEEPKEEPTPEPAAAEEPEPAAAESDLITASKQADIDWRQFEGTTLNALVVKHWWTDAIEPLLPEFEALSGMTVKFDTLSEDTYFQKAVTELSSGSGAHDVLMVGNLQVGQYMNGGWLEPLDGYFENAQLTDLDWYDFDDLLQSGRDAGTLDGTMYALPIGAEAEFLMYRKDIFEEKGIEVPKTYDEMYETALALNSDEMAGYVSRGKRGLDVLWEWTGYLLSFGGRYFDENGKPAFNSPEGVAATEMYVKLLNDAGPEGTINWSWMECSQNFAQLKSAMYIEAAGVGPVVDKEENPVYGKVGYATMPQYQDKPVIPNYWFWMLGMPAGGKNKDAAFLFVEWATSKTLGLPLSSGGSSPARSSVWASDEILTWANPEWAAASLAALDQVQPKLVPYDRADFPEITDAISAEINNVQTGGKDAQQALDDAAAKVEKIVSEGEPAAEEPEPAAAEGDLITASKQADIDWRQFEGTTLNALVVKHWWTDAIEPLLPEFEALSGMTVKFDTLSEDTYFQKAVTELSSGSGAHDVLMVGNLQVGQYMNGGWLEPLDGYFENAQLTDLDWYDFDDLLQSGRDAGTLDGTMYALPIGAEAEFLMYRKDIFEEKGIEVPKTYDEMYETALALNSDEMAGYVSRGKRGLDVLWEWTGYLLSFGGRYFDENGKPAFNSPEGVAATEMYVKLLNDAGPEGTINWSWMECSQNFAQLKSAMYIEAAGVGPVVDKEENPVYGKVGYATMPQYQDKPVIPNYWFWMLGMPAGGKNKDAAFLFVEWATSKTLGLPLSSGGSSPARSSVWASDEILTWANPEWAAASLAALDQVQPKLVPYDRADFPEITDAISAEINNVQTGGKDAQQALDDAAAKVEKIVSESE